MSGGSDTLAIILFFLAIIVYFVPAIVACYRVHHNTTSIMLTNIFLGWTGIGWIAALVWAASSTAMAKEILPSIAATTPGDKYTEIDRISQLKDRGILSEQEFQAEKAKLLSS
ncbi:superinfection immunity protein [Pseudomonas sp. TH10]|uniref:superinfection immunity protein n=1 Tax=Pseudomonas sp. TH10 TaxID=2796376 RepID=UPI001911F79F|nr:superinfection immunity protein [Pseudomonas sp. TH10]MBK5518426.1 superinfection immunity protein [Pseudomonas sp. TH10]